MSEVTRTGERFTKSLFLNKDIFANKIQEVENFYTTDNYLIIN